MVHNWVWLTTQPLLGFFTKPLKSRESTHTNGKHGVLVPGEPALGLALRVKRDGAGRGEKGPSPSSPRGTQQFLASGVPHGASGTSVVSVTTGPSERWGNVGPWNKVVCGQKTVCVLHIYEAIPRDLDVWGWW